MRAKMASKYDFWEAVWKVSQYKLQWQARGMWG